MPFYQKPKLVYCESSPLICWKCDEFGGPTKPGKKEAGEGMALIELSKASILRMNVVNALVQKLPDISFEKKTGQWEKRTPAGRSKS